MNTEQNKNIPADDGFVECTELQRENVKFFKKNDGKRRAVISNAPIATYDETKGRYVDIDNSLIEDTESADSYRNARGSYKAKFTKNLSAGGLFSMAKDNCKLSISLPTETGTARKRKPVNRQVAARITNKEGNKHESELVYENALPNTDLQYIVKPGKVKENIIVRSPQSNYVYDFALKTENLSFALSEDGKTVSFTSIDDGKQVFRIPAPIMIDAVGTVSKDIAYDLQNVGPNEAMFTITANAGWINDPARIFPVSIDPVIELDLPRYISFIDNFLYVYERGNFYIEGCVFFEQICDYLRISLTDVIACNLELPLWNSPFGDFTELVLLKWISERDTVFVCNMPKSSLSNGSVGVNVPLERLITPGTLRETPGFTISSDYSDESALFDYDKSNLFIEYRDNVIATDIAITKPPVKRNYISGQSFDPAGMIITAYYNNGTSGPIIEYAIDKTRPLTTDDKNITISYEGHTKTLSINVDPVRLIDIAITTPPLKTIYVSQEIFDPTGMVVTAYYNDGTSHPVTDYTIDNMDPLWSDDYRIDICYEGYYATQEIIVNMPIVIRLIITTPPTKTTYIEGETFNKAGMIVTAIYNDGKSYSAPYYTINKTGPLTISDKFVTISYQGQTAEQPIVVIINFKNRKPANNKENMVLIQKVDLNGNPITDIVEYAKISLADGASPEDRGTALNAENLNNIMVKAENIVGTISLYNLPESLRRLIQN